MFWVFLVIVDITISATMLRTFVGIRADINHCSKATDAPEPLIVTANLTEEGRKLSVLLALQITFDVLAIAMYVVPAVVSPPARIASQT